eukprot:383492-Pyramimonas_sp.AAC.1
MFKHVPHPQVDNRWPSNKPCGCLRVPRSSSVRAPANYIFMGRHQKLAPHLVTISYNNAGSKAFVLKAGR